MAQRIGSRHRAATAKRIICEAIEPRRYFSLAFGAPSTLIVNGIRSPIDAVSVGSKSAQYPPVVAVATSGAAQILIANNNGTLSVNDTIPFPSEPASGTPIVVGSFKEPEPDLVLLSQTPVRLNGVSTSEGEITYEQLTQAGGTLGAAITSVINDAGSGFIPISATAGDFNDDQLADLAILGKPTVGSGLVLAILKSEGNGTFTETNDLLIPVSNASASLSTELVETTDLGNGNVDIIVYDGSSQNLDVFMGNGAGQFTSLPPVPLHATLITTGGFASRISSDDLVVANGNQLTTLLSNGDGTFTALAPVTLSGTINAMTAGDFNGDGYADVVTNLGILLGNSDGTFQSPIALPGLGGGAVFANTLVATDFTFDGNPDIVGLSSAGNAIAVARNLALPAPQFSVDIINSSVAQGIDANIGAVSISGLDGIATFFDGNVELGTATIKGGQTSFDAGTNLSAGLHLITAQYSGDSTYSPTSSSIKKLTILAPTTIILSSNENPSGFGDNVSLTAIVTGDDNRGDTPPGDVRFFSNGVEIGFGILANGIATLETTSLRPGIDQITAKYGGDKDFLAGSSTIALTQTVNQTALVPQITTTTFPKEIIGDTPVHATARINLANQTPTLIAGPVLVTIFASTNGLVDGATQLIQPLQRNVRIKPGATMGISVPINLSSLELAARAYTLLAQVSYGDGQTTNANSGPAVKVDAPVIALSNLFTVRELPSAFISGTPTRAVATVRIANHGNVPCIGPVTISFSASATQNVIGTTIISVTKKLSVNLHNTAAVTIPLKAIPALADGDYFITVQTTDPQGNIAVASSATTVHATAPIISLSATVNSVNPTPAAPGQPVKLTVSITNSGNAPAMGATTLDIGLSIDGQTVASTLIDLASSLTFAAGTTKTLVLTFDIPADAMTGSFFPTISIAQNGHTASAIGTIQFDIV